MTKYQSNAPLPSKPVGMRELAARLGVSPITVSRALSNPDKVAADTRARVLSLIESEGFVPNQLAGGMRTASRVIGALVPSTISPGVAEQVRGMADSCHAHGYQLLMIQGDVDAAAEERAVRALLGWRPTGLILQAFVQAPSARTLLAENGTPLVEVSDIRGRRPIDMAVGVSNYDIAYEMVQHLASKGYRRIGLISASIPGTERLSQYRHGYRRALADAGLMFQTSMEVEMPTTTAGGAEGLRLLTGRHPDLDALFCHNDTLAVGAVQECHRLGWKIPERLAIAGRGDSDLAPLLYPALTTVHVPRYDIGRKAVEVLVQRVSGETTPPRITRVDFRIVERESA